ncbi:MAG TPA: maleylpyruvate isomerase family mycothiol-dependent enzyme [Acidimicrobiales bacterium]|nr:maleylpyruvate isomerase family mycothiol-dependent enzyme [Acidimicrobiales bacterium]
MEGVDLQQEKARLRRQFADRIAALDETAWSAESWCAGWRVRDVLAHLVKGAEMTYGSLTLDLLRGGFRPNRSVSKAAKRLDAVPVPELADRLRRAADRQFHLVGTAEAMGLVDVLVHSVDALRPLGLDVDAPPADAIAALDTLWTSGRMIVHATPQQGRRLVATDVDWSRGSGPEVRGRGIDLLLFVANRRQVLPNLDGPGLTGN